MRLTKQSKIRMIENFYGLDVMFFGENASKKVSKVCCPALLEEYAVNKGVLLSIVGEMYELMGHSPKDVKKYTKVNRMIEESVVPMVFHAKDWAKDVLNLDESRMLIRKDIENYLSENVDDENSVDIDELIESKVLDKMYSISTDNLLVVSAMAESKHPLNLKKPEGRVLMSAYRVIRDSLIESAQLIRESVDLNS